MDSKYYELQDETIKKFYEVFEKKSFPTNMNFQFVGCSKQKELVKVTKIAEQYAFILQKEILVCFNEELVEVFDDESVTILIEQEIDKITINLDTGKIKFLKTDLNTFSSLVNKYGVEKIARANKVEELYHDQKKDGKSKNDGFIC
ncbi:MAG: hypothetical protein M0R46_14510 [Candidatus Muirbacterium halophilum]|nr:hypothetical protein [Candidatus Muirbacterium halophilum]